MNRLNLKKFFLTATLVLLAVFGLRAAVQYQNLSNATDPIFDISQKNGPANSVFATWGDYDLDGDEDLYVVNNGSPNHLYRNNTCSYDLPCESVSPTIAATHPTSFTKMTSAEHPGLAVLRDGVSASRFAHWIDYDQDGDLDLYLVNDGMNRLFINELFDPAKPYDPFSRFKVKAQAVHLNKFSYKAHPEIKLAMGSEDFMQIVTTVTIPSTINYPSPGTPDILQDTTIDFLQINPKVVPGMYLEISQAADPQLVGRIYTILEVLGTNQLRLDYEQDIQAIFQYRILRDTKADLINTERFINEFQTEGTVISNSLVYEYSGDDANFSLVARQISDGDQVILNSTDNSAIKTLSTLIQVDPRSFTVSPPTEINGQPLVQGFEMNVRRRGGEILVQKIITDRRVGFPIQTITPGDEIEVVSGVNKGSRYVIDELFGQDIIFLKSDAGSTPITATNEEFEYEIIYNGINSTTRRIMTDGGASFGIPAYRIEAFNDSFTRQTKVGDYIIIDPDMNVAVFGEANAGQSAQTALGVRTTFDDGTARPPGILQVKEILDPGQIVDANSPGTKRIVVDAFPSEVITGYSNENFPYQIRHRFGQLQLDAISGELKFFIEAAPNGPVTPRDFNQSLGMNLFPNSPNNPAIIITDALPNAIGNQGVTLRPDAFKGSAVDGYVRTKIELSEAVDPAAFTTTTGLEYRPVYYSLGTQNPYVNPRVLRVFSQQLPPGVTSGHFLVLRGFIDNNAFEIRLNKIVRILEAQQGAGVVDLFLAEDMPDELLLSFTELCTNSDQCDDTDGATESQDNFFTAPENQLSVRYEFVVTNALDAGVQLDLKVEGEVSMATQGLQYNLLSLAAGDSLEYKDPLTGSIRSSEIATFSTGTIAVLTNVDALTAPFNTNIPAGVTGFKPIYRGLLTDFRTITSSNPMMNFTSIAHPLDKISFFSVLPNQGLSLVARVPIGTVTSTFIQLKRRLTLDPSLQSFSPEDFQTNPFYFRVTRSSGNVSVRGAFKDSRQGLDFTRNLSLNPDGTLRGKVLLDLYRTSTKVTDPLYKRFTLSDLLSINRIGLESGAVDQANDIFNNYFYEINQLIRDQGGIIENHTGNGRKVEFADWNNDGLKDIYILNSADNAADLNSNDPQTTALDQNSSQMYYGSTMSGISTGMKFILPEVSPADNENDLRNLRTLITDLGNPLEPRAVLNSDLNDDLEPDLLILNVDEPDKLLLSGVTEGAINRELNSKPENGLLVAPIFAENDVLIGDVNQDGTQDIYYLVGRDPSPVSAAQAGGSTITSNVLFLTSETVGDAEPIFQQRALPILDPNVARMEGGYSLSGAILDYNNDGYADINVMNNDLIYLAEMKFAGTNTIGNSDITIPAICGPSGPGYNRHIAWTDANMDGWPDYYVSRASDVGETNALCIAIPDQADLDNNNYFVVDLYPRNLSGRVDKRVKLARITMLYVDQSLQLKTVNQSFEYNYPYPTAVKFSSGPIQKATFIVDWSDQHRFNYGEFSSTNISGSRIRLEQPGDFYITNNKGITSVQSSPLSTIQTIVGPQTTNIEATGFTIMAGRREPVLLENLSVFFSGGLIFENTRDVSTNFIPNGSIKLYLDASEIDQNSDNFKAFTPDGRFNINHDVEVASGPLLVYSASGGPVQPNQQENVIVYNDILNNDGTPQLGDSVKVGAFFENLSYRSRDGSSITSFILNPSLDSDLPDRLSFIVVYTVDIRQDSEFANPNTKLQVLPYIPKRIYQGSINLLEQAVAGTDSILNNPFEQSFELQLRGQNSSQLNRGILLDETSLGSNDMTVFSTFPFSNLPIVSSNLVGRIGKVDQLAPIKPVLDPNVITSLKESSVLLFGTAEPLTNIQISNLTAGTEPIFADVLADGTWQILLTNMAEGNNQIALISVDFFGNESLETLTNIAVDLTPPDISEEIATNIGIAKATITWKTDESAVGTIYITSPLMPSIEQTFQAENQFLFVNEHSITLGESNNMYLSLDFNTVPPSVPTPGQCQGNSPGTGQPQLTALCPDTTYHVSIEVRDSLGNVRRRNNLITFTTLQTSQVLKDLDSDGIPDQDTDGDGIPDRIESDFERFPDLDMFDNNDALLDFDEDGVNNVEEFSSGFDMYNPFDVLPIANAGIDRTVDPGIIILDSSDSNQNGISTNNLSFRWVMESAPNQKPEASPPSPPEIDNSNAQRTYFTARKAGTYTVSLQILTFQGAESKKDTVNYFVRNISPVANAGPDSIGQISQDIVLDGRSSSDSNGDALTYRWIQLQGPILSSLGDEFGVEDENSARTTFRTNRTGKYVFELVVRDSFSALSRDRVTVLVNSAVDVFPIADAGEDFVGTQGNTVTLQGDRSGGINSSSVLEYEWELITTVTQDVPEECENFRTTNVTAVSTTASTLKNPRIVITEPGIYAFMLTVKEQGKGLESAPDCFKVIINKDDEPLPISRPEIFGEPVRVSDRLAGIVSQVSPSLAKEADEAISVYRVPINYEVQLSGLDSYPSHDVIASKTAGSNAITQLNADQNCIDQSTVYSWRQITGDKISLSPEVPDCSVVKFTPIHVGIYTFGLKVRNDLDGQIVEGLERTIVIIANDNFDEEDNTLIGGIENDFIPNIFAPESVVITMGSNLTLPSPTCMDQDLMASASTVAEPFAPNNIPINELQSCASTPPLTCVWSQINGPTLNIENPNVCTPKFLDVQEGTYTVSVRAFDGEFYSLSSQTTFVAVGVGKAVPQAHAGTDRVGTIDQSVFLDGSLSIAGTNQFDYLWKQVGGMPVALLESRTVSPRFVPPAQDTYSFQLQVQNNSGIRSLPDLVDVFVPSTSISNVNQNENLQGNGTSSDPIVQGQVFEQQGGGGGGGCFIATATSGDKNSSLVNRYTLIRDHFLVNFELGRLFIQYYYHYSPPIANWIENSVLLRILFGFILYPLAFIMELSLMILLLLGGFMCFRRRF